MDIRTLTQFLLWCTVINGAVLIAAIAGCLLAPDMTYDLHSRWFGVPREALGAVIYALLGGYKILWLAFNVVPYTALVIAGKRRQAARLPA